MRPTQKFATSNRVGASNLPTGSNEDITATYCASNHLQEFDRRVFGEEDWYRQTFDAFAGAVTPSGPEALA